MLARMFLLQIIPRFFHEYIPPKGINVAWYWQYDPSLLMEDIKKLQEEGLEIPWMEDFEKQQHIEPVNRKFVIAFFTARELSIDTTDVHKYGAIRREVKANRCFTWCCDIPRDLWSKFIPGFNPGNDKMILPFKHPRVKRDWINRKTIRTRFNGLVDPEVFNKLNRRRREHGLRALAPNVRTELVEGKETRFLRLKFFQIEDEIKEETG